MSDVIRAIKGSWLPFPGAAKDVRVPGVPDSYSFYQSQVESEQRQARQQMSRSQRATRSLSMPRPSPPRPGQYSTAINGVVLTLPLR